LLIADNLRMVKCAESSFWNGSTTLLGNIAKISNLTVKGRQGPKNQGDSAPEKPKEGLIDRTV